MRVIAHPRYREFASLLQKATGVARAWNGVVFRSAAPGKADPVEILSGQGSFHNGGRWNAPGSFRAVYASTAPEVATSETMAYFRYYGFRDEDAMPRLMIAIRFRLAKALDLRDPEVRRKLQVTLSDIEAEDWRKIQDRGKESYTQALGRAVAEAGCEALIAPSAQVPRGVNVVYIPDNKKPASVVKVLKGRKRIRHGRRSRR